jgi:hypothetical protein
VADNYILAIGPHPDDVEAGCGGSVARFIDEGNKLIYLVFSKCLDQKGNEGIVEEVQNSSRALSADKFLLCDLPNRRLSEHGEEILESYFVHPMMISTRITVRSTKKPIASFEIIPSLAMRFPEVVCNLIQRCI